MGSVSEGSNIDSRKLLQRSALQKKCGTCKNFTVKPPEIELAKYALPIGMCAPGVHCLGGAVRGTCTALGVMAESTDLVPRVKCGGRQYVPGGPSMVGAQTPADRARGATAVGSFSRSPVPVEGGVFENSDGTPVAFVSIAALAALKWWLG